MLSGQSAVPRSVSIQLQESDASGTILPQIKAADVNALLSLLEPWFKLKQDELVITDLGCGEGLMLLKLLEVLSENVQTYAQSKIKIYASEPSDNLREKFKNNLNSKEERPYLNNVSLIDLQDRKTEEYAFLVPSDLIMLSHSLYYLQRHWNSQKFTDIPPANNLFKRLIDHLKPQGRVAVLL